MASRRKSTTPCMVPPQEPGAPDQDMEDLVVAGESDAAAAAAVPAEVSGVSRGGGEEEEAPLEGRSLADHYADSASAEGGYECKYCSFRTAELKLFTVHVDTEHPDVVLNSSYVCMECDFHTKRYDALLEHNSRHHPGEDGFTRTMVKHSNQTVFQQTVNDLTFAGGFVKTEEGGGHAGATRGIALSKTPIMRVRGPPPKKFSGRRAGAPDDVIKVESDDDVVEEVEEEEEDDDDLEGGEEEEDDDYMEPPPLSPAPLDFGGGIMAGGAAPRLVAVSAKTPLQVQHGIVVNSPNVLQIKTGSNPPAVLPPGTLAQVLSALQSQQSQPGQSQLLIPLSSIPTYNAAMDNNVLLLGAYSRFPYPSVTEILGLASQTKFSEEQIKVWFSAQRLKHGVSWTPEEVEEARRKKFNGTVQAVPQTITVIPANIAAAANGLHSLFQTCQFVGQPGLVLTQLAANAGGSVPVVSPLGLAMAGGPGGQAKAPEPAAPESKCHGTPLSPDPPGTKPKKSKEQLAELKASYGRRQFATEAEISRLMRVTNLTKRAIKKWFSDTRYNQRNSRDHHAAAPGEAAAKGEACGAATGEGGAAPGGGATKSGGNSKVSAGGGKHTAAIVIDSSDDASDCSPASGATPGSASSSASDPRVKFRHAFPDFTPQKFKEKTAEQLLALEASFLRSATPSDDELSRLRAQTKLTRREVDAWFTERRKAELRESDGDGEKGRSPGATPCSSGAAPPGAEQQTTPPASRKLLKKTPEQLHILKTAFIRSQWPSAEDYDEMAAQSGLPRPYIVNWFGDTRYACKNSNLKWFYLYQSGKVDEALNGGPAKTPKKSRKRFRGWSRRTRRPYPCKRSPVDGAATTVKTGMDRDRDLNLDLDRDLDRDPEAQAGLGRQDWSSQTEEEEEEEEEEEPEGEEVEEEKEREEVVEEEEGDMEVKEQGEEGGGAAAVEGSQPQPPPAAQQT